MRWAAGIDLDEGRLGSIAIFGLRTYEEAIAWHQRSATHKRWWFCKPSGWIRPMPARSDDPLRRVTLNLYEADCKALEKLYGHGWTTNIREIMHTHVQAFTNYQIKYRDQAKPTLGDLE